MATNYTLDALSKLYDHFESSVGFIDEQLCEYDDGEKRNAKKTKEIVCSIIDQEIKELNEMRRIAKKSITQFNNLDQ